MYEADRSPRNGHGLLTVSFARDRSQALLTDCHRRWYWSLTTVLGPWTL